MILLILSSSPRPWGCFDIGIIAIVRVVVFPTPVGVFLDIDTGVIAEWRLPHARGGVSLL